MRKFMSRKQPKELSDEEVKATLESNNIATHKGTRKSKFGGFSNYAKEVAARNKVDYNSESAVQSSDQIYQRQQDNLYGAPSAASNPYAQQTAQTSSNPYATNSHQSSANASNGAQNPYGNSNPYGDAYGSGSNSYETSNDQRRPKTTSGPGAREELFGSIQNKPANNERSQIDELNDLPDGDEDELLQRPSDLNQSANAGANDYEGASEAMNSEDEDVEEIRRQIRFTKQESAQSTRNALRLAADAEASGRNALGMLGSQGERIANTERTLALAESQTKIADDQSKELQRLNRSIFVPNVSNPFNSKRRMQEKEAKIKSEHLQEQLMREKRRQMAFDSEQRVMGGLKGPSETAQRYKSEKMKNSSERKKYQFEEDSEDEMLENEIDTNLEGLSLASKKLHNLGKSLGDEIDVQNRRLDRITDQTDTLDVNVHLNAARLASLR